MNRLKILEVLLLSALPMLSFSEPVTEESVLIDEAELVSAGEDTEDLAKAAQNPIASMVSLPFQNNTTYGMGEYNRAQNVLNVQPVLPFSLGEKVNIINRIILPIITQPSNTEESHQKK